MVVEINVTNMLKYIGHRRQSFLLEMGVNIRVHSVSLNFMLH